MKKITFLLILAFLIAVSCDSTSGPENKEFYDSHMFSFELLDEHGNTVEYFSQDKAGEIEIEQSAGLFGDDFIPPEIVEMITSQIPITPDQLRRDQIYLHAERETDGEIHHVTLNFKFQDQDSWNTGVNHIIEHSEEFWIEGFRRSWEVFREMRGVNSKSAFPGDEFFFSPPVPAQRVVANYLQIGFNGLAQPYSFYSLGGVVELEEAGEQHLKGQFTLELLGLPTNVYQMDEFPEELETVNYTITGEFVALYGNYEDLMNMRADLNGISFFIF